MKVVNPSDPENLPGLGAAIMDLENNTLNQISGTIGKLIYLASTRDYNSGLYHHDGIAFRFNEQVANAALGFHHKRIFREMLGCSIQELVGHLGSYIEVSGQSRKEFLNLWKTLEPFRVVVPRDADPLEVSLLLSNIRAALSVLTHQEQ